MPEPWRSIGQEFRRDCERIAGVAKPAAERRQEIAAAKAALAEKHEQRSVGVAIAGKGRKPIPRPEPPLRGPRYFDDDDIDESAREIIRAATRGEL